MHQRVFIEKLKRPTGRGVWGAYETANDTWGRWLFTPRGSVFQSGTGADAAYCYVGSPTWPGAPVIHLIASEAWWIATFWGPGESEWLVTFDICTPPTFADACWTYTDLELDVLLDASSGEMRIVDDDEFDAAYLAGWIADEEAESARAAVEQIRALIDPASGFLDAGLARLAEGHTLRLPALRHLLEAASHPNLR